MATIYCYSFPFSTVTIVSSGGGGGGGGGITSPWRQVLHDDSSNVLFQTVVSSDLRLFFISRLD